MVVAAFADPERSPLAPLPDGHGGTATALLYSELLGRSPPRVGQSQFFEPVLHREPRDAGEMAHIAGHDRQFIRECDRGDPEV